MATRRHSTVCNCCRERYLEQLILETKIKRDVSEEAAFDPAREKTELLASWIGKRISSDFDCISEACVHCFELEDGEKEAEVFVVKTLEKIRKLKVMVNAERENNVNVQGNINSITRENQKKRRELLDEYDRNKLPRLIQAEVQFTQQLLQTMKSKADATYSLSLSRKYNTTEVETRKRNREVLLQQIQSTKQILAKEEHELEILQGLPANIVEQYKRLHEKKLEQEEFLRRLNVP